MPSNRTNAITFSFLVCALIFGNVANGQTSSLAFDRLVSVDVFAFGGVGYAGVTSTGEKNFQLIMALPPQQALATFESLYRYGNPQAKSYALVGIRKLDPIRFSDLYIQSKNSKEQVTTEEGCIMGTESLAQATKQIAAGAYDQFLSLATHPKI